MFCPGAPQPVTPAKVKMDMLIKDFLAAQSGFTAGRKSRCRIEQNQLFAPELFRFDPDCCIDPRVGPKWECIIVAGELETLPRAREICLRQQTFTPVKLQLGRLRIQPSSSL